MAKKRMISNDVLDLNVFFEIDNNAFTLYINMIMAADDEGFVSTTKKLLRLLNLEVNSVSILVDKGLIIEFGTEIYLITHWKIHNHIKNDRFQKTIHSFERSQVIEVEKKWILVSDSEKANEGNNKIISDPDFEKIKKYINNNGLNVDADNFYNYYESIGFMRNNQKILNFIPLIKQWHNNAEKGKEKESIDSPTHMIDEKSLQYTPCDEFDTSNAPLKQVNYCDRFITFDSGKTSIFEALLKKEQYLTGIGMTSEESFKNFLENREIYEISRKKILDKIKERSEE